MENQPSAPTPQVQPKTPKEEAEALIDELTHPESRQQPAETEPPASFISSLFKVVFNWLVTPAAIVLVLHFFIFQAYQVVGSSMEPTLNGSDYLIISKVGQSVAKAGKVFGRGSGYIPDRDDVVVFLFPKDHKQTFVKRVVGLPGDRVVVKDGRIKVFNQKFPQGFNPDVGHRVSDPVTLGGPYENTVVPEGSIYVVGDNRSPGGSYDSREWGLLPSEDIIGIAVLRLLPIGGMRLL
jgi:signal peptidase I